MWRFWARALIAAGFFSAAAPAGGQTAQERIDVTAFAEVPALERPELSPNGKLLAAKMAVNGKQYFAIIPLDGSEPRYVSAGDSDLNWWRWVNDEWLVVGIAQLKPVDGDEWYISRAVSVNAATGQTALLSARDAGQNADDLVWIASDGTPRILMASQTSIYSGMPGFWPQVDEINVATGKRKMVVPGRDGVWNWYADGGGTVRMGIGTSEDGRTRRVVYRDSARGSFRVIDTAKKRDDSLLVPVLFLKEPGKALMIADDAAGYSALYELDLATLARGKQLFATKGYDIGSLVDDATGYGYLGVRVNEDRPGIRWTDPAMAVMQKAIAATIKGGEPQIVSVARDHSAAVVQVGGDNAPGASCIALRATAWICCGSTTARSK